MSQALGFRKVLDATFMIGFLVSSAGVSKGYVYKYLAALRRAQQEIDLHPEFYKHYHLLAVPEKYHGQVDVRAFGTGERIVFLPYTREVFAATQECGPGPGPVPGDAAVPGQLRRGRAGIAAAGGEDPPRGPRAGPPRIKPMRRESSTLVVLAGEAGEGLLAELGRSGNVSVARAPAAGQPGAAGPAQARPAWETGALAMREAAGAIRLCDRARRPAGRCGGRLAGDVGPGGRARRGGRLRGARRGGARGLAGQAVRTARLLPGAGYRAARRHGPGPVSGPAAGRPGRAGSPSLSPPARVRPAACWMRCGPWSTGRGGRRSTS